MLVDCRTISIRNMFRKMLNFLVLIVFNMYHIIPILSESEINQGVKEIYLTSNNYNTFEYTNLPSTHAESPVWVPEIQTLYWVDVANQNLHALEYTTMKHSTKHIEYGEINIVLPIANSSRLLVGVRSEVFLLDWHRPKDSALRLVAVLDQGKPDNVLNEGKVDACGRFWGGTKGPQLGDTVEHDKAALYSMERPWFTPRIRLKPVTISNGLTWALNNSVMYYIDSQSRLIEAFDFSLSTGYIKNRRTIIDIREYGYRDTIADGMTIDKNGMLWVALMFHGSIIRIDPDARRIVEKFNLPVSRTTSVAWAGPHLKHLVVTTSRRNMDADAIAREPLSGAIFILLATGTSGVPDNKFIFPNADNY